MHEHRNNRRPVGQRLHRRVAEYHALQTLKDSSESNAQAGHQERRSPGMLRDGSGKDQKLAGKDAKGGMPRIASPPNINPHPTNGLVLIRPRMLSITWLPAFCAA